MIYPKLSKTKCKYPERQDCNYGDNYRRCEFMKYKMDGSGLSGLGGHWECVC
jgi:hypothetical protein